MFKNKTFIILLVLILSACGKPDVVKIEQPKDKKLNCENLKLAILEAEQYKKKAMGTREGTAANVARNLLFWPSLVGTMLNADKAIQAAEDRIYHLQVLSIRKNWGININIKQLGFISKLKELKQLRDTDDITQEEYEQGKKKLIKK